MTVAFAQAPPAIEPEGHADLEALLDAAARHRPSYSRQLLRRGALLFRGWQVETGAEFRRFVAAFAASEGFFD